MIAMAAWWRRLFGLEEKAGTNAVNPAQWFIDWVFGGPATASGERVTTESALRLAAVWACIRVRSEDVGKLPCILYRRRPDGGKERATDHPLYRLMHDAPNPRMTAMEFKQLMQARLDCEGNAFALKDIDARGRVTALWPICKAVTILVTPDGRDLFY